MYSSAGVIDRAAGAKIGIYSIYRWEPMKSGRLSTQLNYEPGYLSRNIELFRYNIASCDMRFIERSERIVNLVRKPEGNWCVQGAIPGCGVECESDLALLLLEYLMSCEGAIARGGLSPEHCFSEKVVQSLVAQLQDALPALSNHEVLRETITCIIHSLDDSGSIHQETDRISLLFSSCPLCQKANESGILRCLDQAHDILVDMCLVAVRQLLPDESPSATGQHREDEGFALSIKLAVS